MTPRRAVARDLATVLGSGPWTPSALERRAVQVLGPERRQSIRGLVEEIVERSLTPYAPAPERLFRLILDSSQFGPASVGARRRAANRSPALVEPRYLAIPAFREAGLPKLDTPTALADWLGMPLADLEWLSDARRQHGRTDEPRLWNYTHRWVPKRSGSARLIEAPKARLKAAQRRVLHGILDRIPAHDAAHGFVRGRSCLTAARRHGGEEIVVTLDLRDFFLTVPLRRVHGLFRCAGYPWPVARALTGLCSTATPAGVLDGAPIDRIARERHRFAHLPQGAPTSPALANLCAYRLDCRLDGLARGLDAQYTRYADDLALSGGDGLAGAIGPVLRGIPAIVEDEGFALNPGKTRIMRRHGRQRVTGLVVNDHLNVPRDSYDRLKAILHNCLRHGPDGQNRDGHADFRAHLDGRVTWVETVNRRRGLRLRRMFESVDW